MYDVSPAAAGPESDRDTANVLFSVPSVPVAARPEGQQWSVQGP